AEPGTGAPATRVESAPPLTGAGKRLGCQLFGHGSVSRQVHEECMNVVEVALRRLFEFRCHGAYTSPKSHRVTSCCANGLLVYPIAGVALELVAEEVRGSGRIARRELHRLTVELDARQPVR